MFTKNDRHFYWPPVYIASSKEYLRRIQIIFTLLESEFHQLFCLKFSFKLVIFSTNYTRKKWLFFSEHSVYSTAWPTATVQPHSTNTACTSNAKSIVTKCLSVHCISAVTFRLSHTNSRVTTLQTMWNSMTIPRRFTALLPMLSVTHIMPVIVLLSVVGYECNSASSTWCAWKVKNGCKHAANNKQF